MPAAAAALIPGAESSKTAHLRGSRPSLSAVSRNRSGAGFPLRTWSPPTTTLKLSRTPARSSLCRASGVGVEVATALSSIPIVSRKFRISRSPKTSTPWDFHCTALPCAGKTNVSEPLRTCRKRMRRHQNRTCCFGPGQMRAGPADGSRGDRHVDGGVSPVQALVWNVGTWCLDAKGEIQVGDPRG